MVGALKAKTDYEQDKCDNSAYNYMIKSWVVPDDGETPELEAPSAKLKAMQEQIKELVAVTKAANVTANGGNPPRGRANTVTLGRVMIRCQPITTIIITLQDEPGLHIMVLVGAKGLATIKL